MAGTDVQAQTPWVVRGAPQVGSAGSAPRPSAMEAMASWEGSLSGLQAALVQTWLPSDPQLLRDGGGIRAGQDLLLRRQPLRQS